MLVLALVCAAAVLAWALGAPLIKRLGRPAGSKRRMGSRFKD